jgi:anti-sigma-K factor RskA
MTPEDDLAAAEYALGTLSPGERATLAARRLREPDLDAAIGAWEARLAPLAEAAAPIEPAADLLPAIEARIRAAVRSAAPTAPSYPAAASATALGSDDAVAEWRRRAARWRMAAIAASCVAALLAVGLAVRETGRSSAPTQYVAILQKDAASPAFEVTVDLDKQEFSVRPLAAERPAGKSYELWIIDPRLGPPKSLGVIDEARRGASLGAYDRAIVEDATYAVTVEPPGGSPDGKPSGAPVFVGKLIAVGP